MLFTKVLGFVLTKVLISIAKETDLTFDSEMRVIFDYIPKEEICKSKFHADFETFLLDPFFRAKSDEDLMPNTRSLRSTRLENIKSYKEDYPGFKQEHNLKPTKILRDIYSFI